MCSDRSLTVDNSFYKHLGQSGKIGETNEGYTLWEIGENVWEKCFHYNVCMCGLGFNLEKHQPPDQDPDDNVNFIISNGQRCWKK